MSEKDDLSVAGPYTPISMRKFLQRDGKRLGELTVLVDSTGFGIVQDDENTLTITPQDCKEQALYFRNNYWNGKNISAYLYRYLHFMFIAEGSSEKIYHTDNDVAEAFNAGKVKEDSEEYLRIKNLIEYCSGNTEALQVIGLVQLIGGSLNQARKSKSNLRLFIEQIETGLHPKRERLVMMMLQMLRNDYGWTEEITETKTKDDE